MSDKEKKEVDALKKSVGFKDITELKCEVCKKRQATTTAIRLFETNPIPVCDKCYNDIIEEEEE